VADSFQLQKFVDAQDAGGTFAAAAQELRAGQKRSHWMWFVFPQLVGLGHSAMAHRYALSGLAEARAYLQHPVLGARLRETVDILLQSGLTDPVAIFGSVDSQKLQSSMTLFLQAAPADLRFQKVIDQFFDGTTDDQTEARVCVKSRRGAGSS
jgi:uncharacterized protein (DUF1810 family)